jgi:hypothetical protein
VRFPISENQALKKVFRDAYLAKEKAATGEAWRSRVMMGVRKIGPLGPIAGFWPAFEHLVWRLVPISCVLVVAMSVLLLSMDPDPGHDYVGTVTAELERPTLSEMLGFGS